MNDTNREIEELLYINKDGEPINPSGLDYIPPIKERIEKIKLLLKHKTNLIRLDAAILLTRWGVEEGIDYLEDFINRDAIDEEGEYACRNNIDDCTYDVFSYCLVSFSDENPEKSHGAILLLRKILSFFGKRHFEHRIDSCLQYSDLSIYLIDDFEKAMNFCIENNKIHEASILLRLYAKWGGKIEKTIMYINFFINYSDPPGIKINVAESLFYLPVDIAMNIIPILESTSDYRVKFYLDKFLKSLQ